jgi:urocanate hydratase
VEVDPTRIERRIKHRYLDVGVEDVEEALRLAIDARDRREGLSIGILGNAAEVVPRLAAMDAPIDIVTDQTSAHDPLAYIPQGMTRRRRPTCARPTRPRIRFEPAPRWRRTARMVAFLDKGAEVFDYGNSLRAEAERGGFARAFSYPGFIPAYIRPLFCEGKGPFRWAALSGDPADIAATDRAVLEAFPDNEPLARWIRMAGERVAYQGLPAWICWLGYGERDRMGVRFNELVASGEVQAPS